MSKQKNSSSWATYKRLLSYALPYWFAFLLSIIGYIANAGVNAVLPGLMKYVPVALGQSEDTSGLLDFFNLIEQPQDLIWLLPIALVFTAIGRALSSYLGGFYIALVGIRVVHDLRKHLFGKLPTLPSSYFMGNNSSKMLSLFSYNVEQVTQATTVAVRTLAREGFLVIGLLSFLLYLNWKLTLIYIMVVPLVGLVVGLSSKLLRRYSHRIQNLMGDLTRVSAETIKSITEIKTYGAQEQEQARFNEASKRNLIQNIRLNRVTEISSPLIQVITFSSLALLLWIGLSPAFNAAMGVGDFLTYFTAAAMIARPLKQLTNINPSIQKGIAAAQSIFEVIDLLVEEDKGATIFDLCQGDIECRNLSFRYNESADWVLKDINLNIKAGETVALVGRSGAGKSTLAALLARHYQSPKDSLFIDGVSIERYQLKSLRRQIAAVSQQVVLFEGSIRDNIAYGDMLNATDEQIQQAAESAYATEFTDQLDDGLDSQIGENGMALSGGQRQRIALARAILKNAPILILDEATSALDNKSERYIQKALENIMSDRTTLVIAHRLSTVEKADCIVVLDQGQIIESGTHEQLLAQQGAYHKLCYSELFE